MTELARRCEEAEGLIERLEKRVDNIRGQLKSCERIVELLKPEMDKFDAREAPWDIYTVRMSVDHQSAIRSHNKELADLEGAIAALRAGGENG